MDAFFTCRIRFVRRGDDYGGQVNLSYSAEAPGVSLAIEPDFLAYSAVC